MLTAALTAYIVRRAKIELGKTMKEQIDSRPVTPDANMNGGMMIVPLMTETDSEKTEDTPTSPTTPNGIIANGGFYTTKVEVVNENSHARVPSR